MDIDPCDHPSVDVNEARRLFAIADSDETFDSWLANRKRMAFYQSPRGDLFIRPFQAERPWPKVFTGSGERLAGTLMATYWDVDWPQEDYSDPTTDASDADIYDEPEWRPADIKISGIDGTFRGEVQGTGDGKIVRFTAEVTSLIADAFAGNSDEQLDKIDPEDVISDRWNSQKYGSFLPRPSFTPGEFSVVVGDDDWSSVYPDEDGMYRLEFDGFYWGEVEPPRSHE